MIFRGALFSRRLGSEPETETCHRRFFVGVEEPLNYFDLCLEAPPQIRDSDGRAVFVAPDLSSAEIVGGGSTERLTLARDPRTSELLARP